MANPKSTNKESILLISQALVSAAVHQHGLSRDIGGALRSQPHDGVRNFTGLAQAHNADFPLLSDPTKETAKAYGVLNERGVANRWTFYVDKSGKISYIEKMVKPETSAEDMIGKLAELKVPMTHKGTK